jgi:hypothetical protein
VSVSVPLPRPLPRRALSRPFTLRGRMSRSGFWASFLLEALNDFERQGIAVEHVDDY